MGRGKHYTIVVARRAAVALRRITSTRYPGICPGRRVQELDLQKGNVGGATFEDLVPDVVDERARSLRNRALGPRVRSYIFFHDRFLIISGSRRHCERRESIARVLQKYCEKRVITLANCVHVRSSVS